MIDTILQIFSEHFYFKAHGLLNLAAGLFDITVGFLVLLNNPKSKVNRSFFFLALTTTVWMVNFGLMALAKEISLAYRFQGLSYIGGVCYIPTSFILLSVSWVEKKTNTPLVWLSFIWSTAIMIPMAFSTTSVVGMHHYSWGWYPYFMPTTASRSYAFFLLVPFFIFAGLAFRNFWYGWKRAISPTEKAQFRNFLIGFVIAYSGSIDFITVFRVDHYPFGYISLATFIGIVAYTIVRHQIFEINILVRKFAVIFLIYAVLLALMLPLSSVLIGSVDRHQLPALLGLSVLFGFLLSMGPFIYAYLLRHAFWLRGQSATGLTHELKSPLGAIQSAVDVLLVHHNAPNPDTTKTFDYLHMIEKNAERLEVFINDLLKLAKIQNQDVALEKSHIDLAGLIHETAAAYQIIAEKKGLVVRLDLAPAPALEIDRERIQQVLSNLLSNAIKFSKGGEIVISLEQRGKNVLCSIKDKGAGIPKADLDRVFSRFYQGKNVNKGSGIGLTIAKAWVEAHGGKIWAESEGEGKGTRVTFTLPT